jgi:glucan phosphoethanolaminetransferase (alkaline phosphatase superfamily)
MLLGYLFIMLYTFFIKKYMLNLQQIKNAINAVLAEKGHLSSMRIKGFMVLIGLSFLIVCMGFNIVYKTIYCKTVDWAGIAALFGALTPAIGVVLHFKKAQKSVENKIEENLNIKKKNENE